MEILSWLALSIGVALMVWEWHFYVPQRLRYPTEFLSFLLVLQAPYWIF